MVMITFLGASVKEYLDCDSVKTLFEKKETLRLRLEQVMPYETCNQAKAKPFKASQR